MKRMMKARLLFLSRRTDRENKDRLITEQAQATAGALVPVFSISAIPYTVRSFRLSAFLFASLF